MTPEDSPGSGTGPILEAFHEIGRSLEIGRTADTILAGLRHVLPRCDRATLCVVGLDGESVVCRRARGRDSLLPDRDGERLPERGLLRDVTRNGRSELLAAVKAPDPDLSETSRSALAAPLLGARGRRLGALVAESSDEGAFTDGDRAALASYAAGAAPAIERILFYEVAVEGRKLASELEVAGKVLQDLLPHETPILDGLDIAAVYEPCSQVGGDYYDFVPLGEDRWGIALGDVSGKGIPAALLVAALRAAVFSLANSSLALRAVLGLTNRLLYETVGETRYATLFYGVLDVPLRRIVHINAGHSPSILVRAGGEVEMIHAGSVPVGLFPKPRYFEQAMQLGAGDLLALYTDGITESANRKGELFGRERLADLLLSEREAGTPAVEVCDAVMKAARRHRGGAPDDDATVTVIRSMGMPGGGG